MSIDVNTRRIDVASACIGDRPTVQVVLPGFARGSTGLLVGATGTSKSFLALQTAVSVALGQDIWCLWGGGPLPPGRVVVVNLEDPEDVLRARLHDIASSVPLSPGQMSTISERVVLLSLYGAGFRLACRRDGEIVASDWVPQIAEAAINSDLVVVDTFNLAAGGFDENSSGDMSAVISIVASMCRTTGAACMLVHHVGKAGLVPKAAHDAARGSSAIASNTRWQALLRVMDERDARARGLDDDERRCWVEVDIAANYGASQPRRWLRRGEGGVLDGRQAPPAPRAAPKVSKAAGAAEQAPQRKGGYRDAEV